MQMEPIINQPTIETDRFDLRPLRRHSSEGLRAQLLGVEVSEPVEFGCATDLQPARVEQRSQIERHSAHVPIDARIVEVESLPERMWADLTARLGWSSGEVEPDASAVAPEPGVVESTVLPAVHGIVETLMRGFVWIGALCVLALSALYAVYGEVSVVDAVFFGLQTAVLAIVLEAVLRIGKRVLKRRAAVALEASET